MTIIILVSNSALLIWLSKFDSSNGVFLKYLDLIILDASDKTVWEIQSTTTHEIGHYIWFNKLNKSLRNEFGVISLYYRENDNIHCITGYENKTIEDFADSYRAYEHGLYWKFQECRDKLNFFKKINKLLRIR